MKVISTNIAQKTTIKWKGKDIETGIFKKSVSEIFLGYTDVENDNVIERKYHGGVDKACYLYSSDHYQYWKELYPDLDWSYGMFGENITVKDLDETELYIGDIFEIGSATIQISEPRLPCYKLGVRFGSQKIIKEFNNTTFSGAYVRVLKNGIIKPNDEFKLVEKHNRITLSDVYSLFSSNKNNQELIKNALNEPHLADEFKKGFKNK